MKEPYAVRHQGYYLTADCVRCSVLPPARPVSLLLTIQNLCSLPRAFLCPAAQPGISAPTRPGPGPFSDSPATGPLPRVPSWPPPPQGHPLLSAALRAPWERKQLRRRGMEGRPHSNLIWQLRARKPMYQIIRSVEIKDKTKTLKVDLGHLINLVSFHFGTHCGVLKTHRSK